MKKTSNLEKRDMGEAYLIKALQRNGMMSQSDAAEFCGLSHSAISRIAERLKEKGLLMKTGTQERVKTAPGRPFVMLELNRNARAVICAYVSINKISFMMLSFDWKIEVLETIEKERRMNVKELSELLVKRFKDLSQSEVCRKYGELSGYALLMSGSTDGENGIVFDSSTVSVPSGSWNISAFLSSKLGKPIAVDSEANAALHGEIESGVVKDRRMNAVYVHYDEDGTVLAFYFNGRIYRGCNGAAPGQIESYSYEENPPGLCREARTYWLPPTGLSAEELVELRKAGIELETGKFVELFRYQHKLEGKLKEILLKRLRMLGRALNNIYSLLSPDKIILGGSLPELDDELFKVIKSEYEQSPLRSFGLKPDIVRGELSMLHAVSIGAGASLLTADIDLRKDLCL